MVELTDISKSFGDNVALHRVNFVAAKGQTSVLIGPSGCGKSTLLRLVIGLVQADAGSIRFDDDPVHPGSIMRLRRRMGYVIQEGGLFPHMKAADNVTLMAHHLGWARPRISERLDTLVQLTQFPPEALSQYPGQLSGGQRQRVSLMRALMLDPAILLLDEPLGALDPMIRSDLQNDLRQIFRSLGKTVIMVTHDMGEAVFFADRILLLNEGRTVQEGSAADLLNAPRNEFVSRFISAQRSHLDATTP